MRACFGGDTVLVQEDFWAWKHEANPFGYSPVLVAESDGRLVGLRTFMRWEWISRDTAVPAVRAVDTVTHPDFRGQGIFTRLTVQLRDEIATEGAAFVFNTPNEKSRPGYVKMGWQVVGKPTVWCRVLRPRRIVRALVRKSDPEGDAPSIHAGLALAELQRAGAASIVEKAEKSLSAAYHVRPTQAYLKWRYGAMPESKYHVASHGEGRDGALAVMRSRFRGGIRELRVCEVVAGESQGSQQNVKTLLRSLPDMSDVDMIVVMPTPGVSEISLLQAGFLPIPRSGPTLTSYPMHRTSQTPDPTILKNWKASIGSLELF